MKKYAAVAILLAAAAAAVIFMLGTFSKSKAEDVSLQLVDSVKSKYGADLSLSDMRVSLVPPEICFGRISVSHSLKPVAEMEGCCVEDALSAAISDEKNISAKCSKSRFFAENAANFAKTLYSKRKTLPSDEKKGGKGRYLSLRFSSDAEIFFGGDPYRFALDLSYSGQNAKISLKEKKDGGGIFEAVVLPEQRKAVIRVDGIELADYAKLIRLHSSYDISAGIISASVNAEKVENSVSADSDVTVKNALFSHPLVDSKPFSLSFFRFKGTVTANFDEKTLSTKDSSVSLGGIDAVVSASYGKGNKELDFRSDNIQLSRLETLVHDDTFDGYLFSGTLGLDVEYSKKEGEDPLFSVSGSIAEPKQLSDRLDYLKMPFEYNFTDHGDVARRIVVGDRNPDFTPISLIPDHLIWAVIVSEDAGFFVHQGIDFQELDAAVKDNIKKHKMRGGSTITQQLAKNLFLSRDKTLLRKFRELLLSIELDASLSKERILEIYLNIVEWAPGVFGIAQASWYYFGKMPFQLTPLESAYLASVIPGPYKYHYMFLNKEVSENWYKSLFRILSIMNETGHLSSDEYLDAFKETIVFRETEE